MSVDTQSLQEQLAAMRVYIGQHYPELAAELDRFNQELAAQGCGSRAPQPGDIAPDFTLPVMSGGTVTLSAAVQSGPVVVMFYRGGWCHYCSLQLQAYQVFLPHIRQLGANVLAISPQALSTIQEMARRLAVTFPLLRDERNAVADQYGLAFRIPERLQPFFRDASLVTDLPLVNADDTMTLPIPGTFIIDQERVVRRAYVNPDHTQRLEPAEILTVLRRL